MTSQRVVQDILGRSGRRFDGRAIHALALTDQEFVDLKSALTLDVGGRSRPLGAAHVAFCLFSAEYLQRHFEGHAWTWQPIWDAIGWRGRADAAFYEDVMEAFARMRIQVVRTHCREWLATLLCQGGLPSRLLEKPYFADYLSDLLGATERLGGTAACSVDLAKSVAETTYLPRRLRNGLVYELAAELVREVAQARSMPEVDSAAQLRGFARSRKAGALGARLMRQARPDPAEAVTNPHIGVAVELSLDDGVYDLRRALLLPSALKETQLARGFGIVGRIAARRLRIEMLEPDGDRIVVARVEERATANMEREFAIRRLPLSERGRLVRARGGAGTLVLSDAKGDLGTIVGDATDASAHVPIVFGDLPADGATSAIGSGNVRTRRTSVLVVHGPSVALGGGEGRTRLGTVPILGPTGEIIDAEVCRLRASVDWLGEGKPDVEGSIVLASDIDGPPVDLVGRREPVLGGKPHVWFGCPATRDRNGTDVPVDWEVRTPSGWRSIEPQDVAGRLSLRARTRDSLTVVREHLCVVPSDFGVRFVLRGTTGAIQFASRKLRALQVVAGDGAVVADAVGNGVFVVLGHGTGKIEVKLDFTYGSLNIVVPSPARTFQFETRRLVCAPGCEISIERIDEVRARVVDPAKRRAWLSGRIAPYTGPWVRIAALRSEQLGATELRLGAVRERLDEMLGLGEQAEDALEVAIFGEGDGEPASGVLRIVRSEDGLDVTRDGRTVTLNALARALPDAVRDELQLEVASLTAPHFMPVKRTGDAWDLSELRVPSIVVARHQDRVRFRPRRVGPRGCISEDPLDRALLMEDRAARRAAITDLLGTVGTLHSPVASAPRNREHDVSSMWSRIAPFVATLGDLPAPTFDAVRAVAANPFWAAYAVLDAAEQGDSLRAVWRAMNELPTSWYLIPTRAWVRAMGALRAVARRAETRTPTRQLTALRLGQLESRLLYVILELLSCTVPDVDGPTSERLVRPVLGPMPEQAWIKARSRVFVILQQTMGELAEECADAVVPRMLQQVDDSEWLPSLSKAQTAEYAGLPLRAVQAAEAELPFFKKATNVPSAALVVRAAAWAAIRSLEDGASWSPVSREHLRAVRLAASMAPELFDLVHASRLCLGLSRRLQSTPDYYDDD
jgi:hypothetical protein